MKLMNTQRKQIMIRVPLALAEKYQKAAEEEGFAILNAWIISVLNARLANKLLTNSQQQIGGDSDV